MSRIGKKPIQIPEKVKITVSGQSIMTEGVKGKLSMNIHPLIGVVVENQELNVKPAKDTSEAKALHGLHRTLIANMVKGVSEGFVRELEINGVGYRAAVKGQELQLSLGFSHPVIFQLPKEVKASVDAKSTRITLESMDKQLLGVTAAKIRSFRPPEPYLGKGIKYVEEKINRKEGKSAGK